MFQLISSIIHLSSQAAEKFKEPEPVNTTVSDAKVESAQAEESDGEEVFLSSYSLL